MAGGMLHEDGERTEWKERFGVVKMPIRSLVCPQKIGDSIRVFKLQLRHIIYLI